MSRPPTRGPGTATSRARGRVRPRGCVRRTAQWPVPRLAPDRPPQVDDLETAGEQHGHVRGREVPTYTGGGGVRGLFDVYLGHGLMPLGGVVEPARAAAADRWGRR